MINYLKKTVSYKVSEFNENKFKGWTIK